MKNATVLSSSVDPFRVDKPDAHKRAAWFAQLVEDYVANGKQPYLRGLHYFAVGRIRPDGTKYQNTDAHSGWLIGTASKEARWLGYVPFDLLEDHRHDAPVIHVREGEQIEARLGSNVGWDIPAEYKLIPVLDGFEARQPNRVAIVGEKTSLRSVIVPIADAIGADYGLCSGTISDTMIHQFAKAAAGHEQRLVWIMVSDCDPAGFGMPGEVSRKLAAHQLVQFPKLEWEVHHAGLRPGEQLRAALADVPGLPSSPIKEKESRREAWIEAWGHEQYEVDAVMDYAPGVLRDAIWALVRQALDLGLDNRVREARSDWMKEAREAIENHLGNSGKLDERLAIRSIQEATAKLEAAREEAEHDALPEPPELPEAELSPTGDAPLCSSDWDDVDQITTLKARKRYEDEEGACARIGGG